MIIIIAIIFFFSKHILFKTKNPGTKHNIYNLKREKNTILHSEHSKINNFI